jgi:hypothetical protein
MVVEGASVAVADTEEHTAVRALADLAKKGGVAGGAEELLQRSADGLGAMVAALGIGDQALAARAKVIGIPQQVLAEATKGGQSAVLALILAQAQAEAAAKKKAAGAVSPAAAAKGSAGPASSGTTRSPPQEVSVGAAAAGLQHLAGAPISDSQPKPASVDLAGFIECAIATNMVFSQRFLCFLCVEGEVSFGIPPLRLVKGSTLAKLKRFPRSDEAAHIVVVKDLDTYNKLGCPLPTFVSHRWGTLTSADTPDNQQALALLGHLDSFWGADKWHDNYYWIDWACIDQDDPQVKWRQVQALPVYMRCCNFFVGLCWGKYFQRAWCRLELKGFRQDADRQLVMPEAAESRSVQYCEVDDLTGGAPEKGECHDDDLSLIHEVMVALSRVDAAFNPVKFGAAATETDVCPLESAELDAIREEVTSGDAAKVKALLQKLPPGVNIDACSVGPDQKTPLGWNQSGSNVLQMSAYQGHLELVAMLLDHGASTGLRDKCQKTAWCWASHPHSSPAYPMIKQNDEAFGDQVRKMQQCVELFEQRAKAGHEGLAAEAKVRAQRQAMLDEKLTHKWQVCMW